MDGFAEGADRSYMLFYHTRDVSAYDLMVLQERLGKCAWRVAHTETDPSDHPPMLAIRSWGGVHFVVGSTQKTAS